jgi:hypothetical protein
MNMLSGFVLLIGDLFNITHVLQVVFQVSVLVYPDFPSRVDMQKAYFYQEVSFFWLWLVRAISPSTGKRLFTYEYLLSG